MSPRRPPNSPPSGPASSTASRAPRRPATRPGSRTTAVPTVVRTPPATSSDPSSRHTAVGPRDPGPPRVSVTSAQRFARRVRARRWRRLLWTAVTVALVGGLGWVVWGSPWLRVRSVEVHGVERIPGSQVQELAAGEVGEPLVLVSTDDLERRVGQLRLVRDVTVRRVWPRTVRVTVRERRPVAALPQGAGFVLVDPDGVVVEQRASAPKTLPRVEVDLARAGARTVDAAVAVWSGLPGELRDDVRRIGADTPDGVWLRLAGGGLVRWGDAGRTGEKVAALSALRRAQKDARMFDVTSPSTPAYRD